MSEVIVVTSGKGGVGKTTTSASFATGLAQKGYKTVVIDFDVGLRNLDLVMGCERRVVYDLVNVIQGDATINQALIKDKNEHNKGNLYILAASQTRDKDVLTKEGVEKVINELKETFDYVICDSPAGIEKGAHMAMYFADSALIVTNPEVSSVRDSDRILGLLGSKTQRAEKGLSPINEHLIITRYSEKRVSTGEMLSVADIKDLLGVPLLGIVPECQSVLSASNAGAPVIHDQNSAAGKAYARIIARFLGEEVPEESGKQKGFLRRLFKNNKEKETV